VENDEILIIIIINKVIISVFSPTIFHRHAYTTTPLGNGPRRNRRRTCLSNDINLMARRRQIIIYVTIGACIRSVARFPTNPSPGPVDSLT